MRTPGYSRVRATPCLLLRAQDFTGTSAMVHACNTYRHAPGMGPPYEYDIAVPDAAEVVVAE